MQGGGETGELAFAGLVVVKVDRRVFDVDVDPAFAAG